MATIKVKDTLYSSAVYGNLDSDERALFWELLGMTRFGEMIRVEDAAFKLRRPADAKPCRSVKQSLQILERAGLVRVEDGRLEIISADAYAHSNAPAVAKAREKKKAMEMVAPQPFSSSVVLSEPAMAPVVPSEPATPPAPKTKRTSQVSRSAIPASVKFNIPTEFDQALFQRFLEIRATNSRKKIIQEMADDWSAQIQALRTSGVDLAKALRCAVSKSWQGFYPIPNGWIDPLAPEESKTPEPLVFNIPDFVPTDLFNEYLEKRARFANEPLDQTKLDQLIFQLTELFNKNFSMKAVITRSIKGNGTRPYFKFAEEDADRLRQPRRGGVCL